MREIKFRAWDTKMNPHAIEDDTPVDKNGVLKKMVYFELGDMDDQLIISSMSYIEGYSKIMQYTGLKDKNGKEIYEGDVVKIFTVGKGKFQEDRGLEEIHWWRCCFCRGIRGEKGLPWWWLGEDTQKFEVIGNIYENPELSTTVDAGK